MAFPVWMFSLFVFSHPLHKSNRCEARHRCGYLFIYYHNEAALLGLFLASPCAATAVISSPHLISQTESDHTHRHRHHHRLISFQGLWRFFPATISCSISVWLFFCCLGPSSIMRVHYASVCLDNVPARSWSRKWKSYAIVSFCCSTAFLSFQFC